MRIGLAFRAFFRALLDSESGTRIQAAIEDSASEETGHVEPSSPSLQDHSGIDEPARSDAITLLAAIQRESRLLDLVYENLSAFEDEQVGAAARPCLQQCRSSLDRMLAVKPLCDAAEGDTMDIDTNVSPIRYQRVGDGVGNKVRVVHHGWQAGEVQLPEYNGGAADASVIAPIQIEGV